MTDAAQKVQTDQFIGLLNEFALPEPEIEVRAQHVIGLGRDVNVLTSGRETMAGGNLELNAHTLRWLKYALGGHTAKSGGEYSYLTADNTVSGAKLLNIKNGTATFQAQKLGTTTKDAVTAVTNTTYTGADLSTLGTNVNILLGAKTASGSSTTINLVSSSYNVTHENANGNGGIFRVLNSAGNPLLGSFGAASGTALTACADLDSGALAAAQAANATIYLCAGPGANISIGDFRVNLGTTIAGRFAAGDYVQIFDKDTHNIPGEDATLPTVYKHEIRRVIAVSGAYLYVEEAFLFNHTSTSCGAERLQYLSSDARGSPHIDATTKELKNAISHTIFGHTIVPSFTIEQSFRQTDATPGGEQLLRLYNGCKVNGATVEADTEGELKVKIEYEAARHYTDTASVFTPHRMFENTAHTATNRKVSGIAIDGEKPYLFQDMSIEAFGRPVLRGTDFNFSITNNNTARWFIRGYEGQQSDTDQVQNGGTQTPLDITEARREYTFAFKALIEDDRMWEQLRTRKHHKNTNDITIRLNKRGSASTRQSAVITLEDYTITKADHQIPSDKGPITADVEIIVRHLKITEESPYFIM
jgi:hypothetical protein